MSNESIFEGQWKQLKGQLQQTWGKLTDDDMDRIDGNRQELIGILQERYGRTKEETESEVADFFDKVNEKLKS